MPKKKCKKPCKDGTICNCESGNCILENTPYAKKLRRQGVKLGDCDSSNVMTMLTSILSPFNVKAEAGASEETDDVESMFDKVKKRLPDNFGVYGISSVAVVASVRWALLTAWDTAVSVVSDYIGPNLPYMAMILILCSAAYWGVNKYKNDQALKDKIGKWHAYITAVHEIIQDYDGAAEARTQLEKLKKKINKYCSGDFVCEDQGDLIARIDRILDCEDSSCKSHLNKLMGFLKDKLKTRLRRFKEPRKLIQFMAKKGDFSCSEGEYKITLKDDEIKCMSSAKADSMSYSLPRVSFTYPEEETERHQNVFAAAIVAVKDALVKENNAIHLVQYNFLNSIVKNSMVYDIGWFSSAPKEQFKELVTELKEVTAENLDDWAKFFCQFDTHFEKLQKLLQDDPNFKTSVRLLKKHIKQIQTVREIQIGYILDLYNAYLSDVSKLTDPVYLEKYLCLITDADDNTFTGLCGRAMSVEKIIPGLASYMQPAELLRVYKRTESRESYFDTFKKMQTSFAPGDKSEYKLKL